MKLAVFKPGFMTGSKAIPLLVAAFLVTPLAMGTYPDPKATPGSLCTEEDRDFHELRYASRVPHCERNVSRAKKARVAEAYGVAESDWPQYEFDHLIPLCAGGSNDESNLWPEPLDEAKEKDKLENELCRQLRDDEISGDDAVRTIRAWVKEHEN